MKIDFNEEKHEYTVGGVHIPSVSEILAPLNAERYGKINPAVVQQAAERGRAIHGITEQIDYGLEPDEDEVEMVEGYIDAYYQFLFDHEVEWSMVERIVACYRGVEGEPPLYCGTVDRFGIVDGKAAVVDIKTYASMSTESQMTASCQTALYRDALLNGKPGDSFHASQDDSIKRYILHLKKDGKYRLIDLDNFDEKRGWNGPSVAGELLHLYYEKQAALAGKKGKK